MERKNSSKLKACLEIRTQDLLSDFGKEAEVSSISNYPNVPLTIRQMGKQLERSVDSALYDGRQPKLWPQTPTQRFQLLHSRRSSQLVLRKSFEEDKLTDNQLTRGSVTQPPKEDSQTSRPIEICKTKSRLQTPRRFVAFEPQYNRPFPNMIINSNDESEMSCKENTMSMSLMRNSHILDDSYLDTRVAQNINTQYLNVIVAGESNLGKLSFIQSCFHQLFKKSLPELNPQDLINEFTHEVNGKKMRKQITLAHCRGYSDGLTIKEWYARIKKNLKNKMATYEELKELYSKDKRLQKQPVPDSRYHLCLYFIQSPKVRPNEIVYMKKLQKYVNILPVVVENDGRRKVDYEFLRALKSNIKQELLKYDLEIFDFLETDFAMKQLRDGLVGKSVPFFLTSTNHCVDPGEHFSDLNVLLKMIAMPYTTPFLYKTEILHNSQMRKLTSKQKHRDRKKEHDNGVGIGLGVAFGLGFVGALVAFKNKLL